MPQILSFGGAGAEEKGKSRPAPVVKFEPATTDRFVETMDAAVIRP